MLVGGQTEQQARTQFSVWAVIGAPLIISDDLQRASDYMFEVCSATHNCYRHTPQLLCGAACVREAPCHAMRGAIHPAVAACCCPSTASPLPYVSTACCRLSTLPPTMQTYGNEEVIAVDQDPAVIPGFRAVGTNLTYPCTGNGLPDGALAEIAVVPCNASDPRQVWRYNADGTLQLVAGPGKAVMGACSLQTARRRGLVAGAYHQCRCPSLYPCRRVDVRHARRRACVPLSR